MGSATRHRGRYRIAGNRHVAAILATLALVAACGAPGTPASPSAASTPIPSAAASVAASTAPSAAPSVAALSGEINVAAPTGFNLDAMTEYAKVCMEKYPGTKINVTAAGDISGAGTYYTKLPDLLKTGDTDVAFLQHNSVFQSILAAGLLEPVEDVWADPALGLADAIPPSYKQLWTEPDGKTYGLPLQVVWFPEIYYNKDLFAKAGVEPPANGAFYTSNDEFYAAVAKLKKAGYGGMTITGDIQAWFDHQVSGLANNMLTPDDFVTLMTSSKKGSTPSIKWDDPRAYKIFEVMKDYVSHGIYPDGFLARDYDTSRALFATGKVAMLQDGSWTVGSLKTEAPNLNYGWMLFPQQRPDIKPPFGVSAGDGVLMGRIPRTSPSPRRTSAASSP